MEITESFGKAGVEAVIPGYTEIALLTQQEYSNMPLYDTTNIHAAKAVELALSD